MATKQPRLVSYRPNGPDLDLLAKAQTIVVKNRNYPANTSEVIRICIREFVERHSKPVIEWPINHAAE